MKSSDASFFNIILTLGRGLNWRLASYLLRKIWIPTAWPHVRISFYMPLLSTRI